MAVMSALLGFRSERRWLRYVNKCLAGMFSRRIGQSGYNKRVLPSGGQQQSAAIRPTYS